MRFLHAFTSDDLVTVGIAVTVPADPSHDHMGPLLSVATRKLFVLLLNIVDRTCLSSEALNDKDPVKLVHDVPLSLYIFP